MYALGIFRAQHLKDRRKKMLNLYEKMDIDEIVDESIIIYDFVYHGTKKIPANGTNTLTIPITSDADFLCKEVTGNFSTLSGAAVDAGVNGISFNITDEGRNIKLFNTQIPASLVFSPGRTRSPGVAGDPSSSLFYPKEFIYPFLASSSIIIELSNILPYENIFKIAFFGTKYRVAGRNRKKENQNNIDIIEDVLDV